MATHWGALMMSLWRGILGGGLPSEPVQVELLEDDWAELTSFETGARMDVPRSALPLGVHEGDVLVHGEVNREATEEARDRVHRAQASATPLPTRSEL